MYDVTNRDSFRHIVDWLKEVKDCSSYPNLGYLLIGNKSDLEHERKVTYEDGQALAKEIGCDFLETSAKTAFNVDAAFDTLAKKVVKNLELESFAREPVVKKRPLKLGAPLYEEKKQGRCC